MPDQLFETALESSLEATFNEGANIDPRIPADSSATQQGTRPAPAQEAPPTDPAEQFAQLLARAQSAERDTQKAADSWLDTEIGRITREGVCCGDGTHFDADGVLGVMLELNTADIDKAWKVWHDRTFSVKAAAPTAEPDNEVDDERGRQTELSRNTTARTRELRARAGALTDVAHLKQRYQVKREPHRVRTASDMRDHPRIDALLERALSN